MDEIRCYFVRCAWFKNARVQSLWRQRNVDHSPIYIIRLPDSPVLPLQNLSMDQSSSLLVKLYGGFDIPRCKSVIVLAGAPTPDLRTVWYGGIRITFLLK